MAVILASHDPPIRPGRTPPYRASGSDRWVRPDPERVKDGARAPVGRPEADRTGMGKTVGISGMTVWGPRLRRLGVAVLAMIAVVVLGPDAVAATTPPGQDVSWP